MDWLCHSDKVGARGMTVIAICLWWVNREDSATLLFFIAYKGKGLFISRWRVVAFVFYSGVFKGVG